MQSKPQTRWVIDSVLRSIRIKGSTAWRGRIAQLARRTPDKGEVDCSNQSAPIISPNSTRI